MHKIGDYKMFYNLCQGWYVAALCPHNPSNPQPDNAFWQQVSPYYQYQAWAKKFMDKKISAA